MAKSRVGKALAGMWANRPRSSGNKGLMVQTGLMRPARGKPFKKQSRYKKYKENKAGKRGIRRFVEGWKL